MAVAVEMSFKGATLAQYEQVIKKMGFSHGGKVAFGVTVERQPCDDENKEFPL